MIIQDKLEAIYVANRLSTFRHQVEIAKVPEGYELQCKTRLINSGAVWGFKDEWARKC